MSLIQVSVKRPIAVVAAILMVVLFGLLALTTIPIQLTPDISRPVIQITTYWPGTAPAEIEREIINRQEEVLQGIEGLKEISSSASTGRSEVTLEFDINQDMNRALLLVSNRLDRVTSYPDEADEPSLQTASSEDSPIAWFVLTKKSPSDESINNYGTLANETIKDILERVPGVAKANIYGGSDIEMQIIIDPETLAHHRLTINDLISRLRTAKSSISAGYVDEGKRRYVIRTEAEFDTLDQVKKVVVKSEESSKTGRVERIRLSDIATIQFGYKKPTARIRHLGNETIAMNAIRETGANVIETMDNIKQAIHRLNTEVLPEYNLQIKQVYDETIYINSSIDLVQKNIIVGGLLAATILMLFLRSTRATLIISIAIPISVIGSFVAMAAMGRSINVISLAGLAFAVGMVVDAAIVVLENIFRHRQNGLPAIEAAVKGAGEVWGAILVSALTTVMVFIPVLTMKLEIAQLFRDIAVAISISVLLSLLVAITIIPAMSSKLFKKRELIQYNFKIPFLDDFAKKFSQSIIQYLKLSATYKKFSLLIIISITFLSGIGTYLLLPKLEYLPEGNRNLIFGMIVPPPGYNLDTTFEIANRIESASRFLWETETGADSPKDTPPKISNFFFVARNNLTFVGAAAVQKERVSELIPILSRPIYQEPGTFGFISQSSLFGRSISSGRSIDFDISGPNLPTLIDVALKAMIKIQTVLPREEGNQFRPIPGLELGAPEIRVIPDNIRIVDNGLSNLELASTIKVFNDGFRVEEITVDGRRIDLTLMGKENEITQTQNIGELPVITPYGKVLPVNSLADVLVTSGPTEIRHKNRERTITLQIRPANHMPLEVAMEKLQNDVIKPLTPSLPEQTQIRLSGTADKLTETWEAMITQLLIALIIVYLVMAVLLESFFYPLIILFSVPIAAIGGVLGLAILNNFVFQPLDMLTMLGFIILIGIVVNNAILIVHHTLQHINQDKLSKNEAILIATEHRIRPIFMSTLTSLFGMFPLVLFPGSGSELYRGLGSVVLGGLTLSAILTLILIPSLMQLVQKNES